MLEDVEKMEEETLKIRKDFPILNRKVKGKPLVYLDNAATSQKPKIVIETLNNFYSHYNANIHRGIHELSAEATDMHEEARQKVANFINAKSAEEIIFVRNATEAINLVAYTWGLHTLQKGDRVVSTVMEHHSNIVPWQFIRDLKGIDLVYADVTEDGLLDYENMSQLINENTKLVTVTLMSNVLGTINDVKRIVKQAHEVGALVLVDGAQGVPHLPVDVQELECDFLAFSGHKMMGPTGIGVLYGKKDILLEMPPFLGGGDMIKEVHLDKTTFNDLPWKFEAGTPNIAGAIGLGAAVDYLSSLGMEKVRAHEKYLTEYALEKMSDIPHINIIGPKDASKKGGVISFTLGDIHPHDIASILNEEGIAVRSGHHCAQPLLERFGINATARASMYVYNTRSEIDVLVDALNRALELFGLK